MKLLLVSTLSILFISGTTFASTSVTCELRKNVGEDGADNPIAKVQASDTKTVSSYGVVSLEGKQAQGLSEFSVVVANGEATIKIEDFQYDRVLNSRVYGLDINKPKFRFVVLLDRGTATNAKEELILNCLGN